MPTFQLLNLFIYNTVYSLPIFHKCSYITAYKAVNILSDYESRSKPDESILINFNSLIVFHSFLALCGAKIGRLNDQCSLEQVVCILEFFGLLLDGSHVQNDFNVVIIDVESILEVLESVHWVTVVVVGSC